MKFQGLPADLHVGALEVLMTTPPSFIETCTCVCCGKAGPTFFVCSVEHITCPTCSILSSAASVAWCAACQHRSRIIVKTVPISEFSDLYFTCTCGFEGTLAAIREHLLQDDSHTHASDAGFTVPPPVSRSPVQLDKVREVCRSTAVRDVGKTKLPGVLTMADCKEQIEIAMRGFQAKMDEVKEKMAALEEHMNATRETVWKEMSGLTAKIADQVATSSKAFFWFDFDKLQRKFSEKSFAGVTSEWQYKVTAGICFGVVLRLERIGDVNYVGLLAAPKTKVKLGFPWPVSRRITLSIHDKNGLPVVNKFYDYIYQTPQGVGAGFLQFLEVPMVHSRECLVQGKICVSLELGPTF